MQTKRIFSIKVVTQSNQVYYAVDLIKYDIGYRIKHKTSKIKSADAWLNKKTLDKIVEKLNRGLFQPGFDKSIWSKYKYEVIETTPISLLRMLKLKKITKKVKQNTNS